MKIAITGSSGFIGTHLCAASKLAAEDIVNIAPDKMRSVIIRPPLIYGRNCRANFMMLSKAIAKGLPLPLSGVKNQRSFLYIGNLCSFIAHALKTEAVQGAYNLADDTALSTPRLIRQSKGCAKRSKNRKYQHACI